PPRGGPPGARRAGGAPPGARPGGRPGRGLPTPPNRGTGGGWGAAPPQPYFPAVTVPVVLMPAGGRRNGPLVAAAASALRDAKIREYPGADHDVHAQRPDEVADDLLGLA